MKWGRLQSSDSVDTSVCGDGNLLESGYGTVARWYAREPMTSLYCDDLFSLRMEAFDGFLRVSSQLAARRRIPSALPTPTDSGIIRGL